MRFPFSMATVVASFLVLGVSATFSASAARGQEIAVVDIQHIFKNHYWFKSQMDGLSEQAKRTDLKLRQLRKIAEDIKIRLNGGEFQIGSMEYRNLQEDFGRAQTKFAVETQESRKWFLEEKSKIYYKVYTEISRSIETFAKGHKITLVLQFIRNDDVDPKNHSSVDRMIKNPIVFQDRIDITEAILKSLPGAKAALGSIPGSLNR
ncbi:MAG: OmpH family outer membrane protein [Planctomycetes bacterium]|nr:OmpH family outer membrane protein [Planctomycetota bacterium]